MAADRRAGKGIPHVGKQPRSRNEDGTWRKKRSDAGKPRPKKENYGRSGSDGPGTGRKQVRSVDNQLATGYHLTYASDGDIGS